MLGECDKEQLIARLIGQLKARVIREATRHQETGRRLEYRDALSRAGRDEKKQAGDSSDCATG